MNYINEYKMIYSYYNRNHRVSVLAEMEKPQPLTESMVRKATLHIVQETLREGENPYLQAKWMREEGIHHDWAGDAYIPKVNPEDEEAMNDPENIQMLVDWIMETEEMQFAVQLFKDQAPLKEDEEVNFTRTGGVNEEDFIPQVQNLLEGLVPTEGDWQ